MNKDKSLTIAQQAGYARRKLKNRGIEALADHRGKEVPVEYVPDIDLLKHFETLRLIDHAERLERELSEFKHRCQATGDDMHEQLMRENEIRDSSVGGFTLGTFDKSHKVIFKMDMVQARIPEELQIAQGHWEQFLEQEFPDENPKEHWLYDLVNDLLNNTKGQIDLRQIGKLNRMAGKVKNKSFHRFLKHLNQAYDTRHTKRYEQFQRRTGQGDYDSIVLTYSSLEPIDPEIDDA